MPPTVGVKTILKLDYVKVKCVADIELEFFRTTSRLGVLHRPKPNHFLAGKLGLEYLNVLQLWTSAGVGRVSTAIGSASWIAILL
jgi:hypothetical protein